MAQTYATSVKDRLGAPRSGHSTQRWSTWQIIEWCRLLRFDGREEGNLLGNEKVASIESHRDYIERARELGGKAGRVSTAAEEQTLLR